MITTLTKVAIDQGSDCTAVSFSWSDDLSGHEKVTWSIFGVNPQGNVVEVGCVQQASGQLTQFVLDHSTGTMTLVWVYIWIGEKSLTARFFCRDLQDVKFENGGAIRASLVIDDLGVHDEHRIRIAA